jgi:cyanophycin synthetase
MSASAQTRAATGEPAEGTKAAAFSHVPEPVSGDWALAGKPHQMPGFAYGLPYPAVLLRCIVPATTPDQRAELAQRFDALFKGVKGIVRIDAFGDPAVGSDKKDTAVWFCALAGRLQRLAGLPVEALPKVVGAGPRAVSLAVPALARGLEPTAKLLSLVFKAFAASEEGLTALREQAHAVFPRLLASALTTSNTPRLVKAAVESGIAFQEFPGSLVQYGIGRKSVLMDSTFTHHSSNIAARLAKYKHWAAGIMTRAGLPTPANAIALNVEQAVSLAKQLGYPVVIKPADKDGGIAVQADLRTEDEVRSAFAVAAKVSKSVMVEKFITGRDYRITVFHGKAIWAVERMPAGVTGDGISTVEELVNITNADPRRGDTVYAALKKIKLDDEALSLLARDGMGIDSVPEEGQFVRLRRSSNVTSGGMPVTVTDRMHPDNARLAERATSAIGLDLAGVDLIIPDIGTSWREVESGICEINAQPELGGVTAGHLYPMVLKTLVGGDGHVPTVAVLGGREAEELTAKLAAALTSNGICVGSHERAGVRIGGETILTGRSSTLRAGRILTMDRRVEGILLGALDGTIIANGLPVHKIDLLLLTGDMPNLGGASGVPAEQVLSDLLRVVLPHCRAVTLLEPSAGVDPSLSAILGDSRRVKRIGSAESNALLAATAKGMVNAVRNARRGPGRAGTRPARQQTA